MRPTTVIPLLFLCVPVFSVKLEIELLKVDSTNNCHKYTEKGAEYLTLTHARLLEFDPSNGKILANTECGFKYKPDSPPGVKNEFKATCVTEGKTSWKNFAIMISVTAQKQSLHTGVDYRYNKETMGLEKYLDNDKMKNEPFEHNRHIQVKRIKISDGVEKEIKFASCHDIYPSSLIGDHGLYVLKWDDSKKGNIGWNRMYFDPTGTNERILF